MSRTISTVPTGCLPRSVSAPSMMASAPSRTAFAMSVASARVGRGAETIESHTRVTIALFPRRLHASSTAF